MFKPAIGDTMISDFDRAQIKLGGKQLDCHGNMIEIGDYLPHYFLVLFQRTRQLGILGSQTRNDDRLSHETHLFNEWKQVLF